MAKKFVRGITDIKEINKQDLDTNNVNDLLSDGEHNYIHRKKKDNSEEYHNLTNNLKTITSDNTDLIGVTNYNNSTNTATLHPKHDSQKEQSIESIRNTITIVHGENATTETTKVDTNPQIVLEHANLTTDYGISKSTVGQLTMIGIEYTKVSTRFDLDTLVNGRVRGYSLLNAPSNEWYLVTGFSEGNNRYQEAIALTDANNKKYVRMRAAGVWSQWREQVGDRTVIDSLLNQKQNNLQTNASIGVTSNNSLRQLYTSKQTYTHTNGFLKTYIKVLTNSINPEGVADDEYNFIVKLNKNVSSATFTLNTSDTNKFNTIMSTYGENNTVRISGCVFTLNGSTLTVSTGNNTEQNYVITFSHII